MRPQVEGNQLRGAGAAQIDVLDVLANGSPLDDLDRRIGHPFREMVIGVDTPRADIDPAKVDLVDRRAGPGEELTVDEDRRIDGHILRMQRADPTVVAEEHVVRLDAGVFAPVLEGPLDHEIDIGRMGDVIRSDIDDVAQLVAEDDIEIVGVGGHRGARNFLQRLSLLVVDLPELVRHHLQCDGIDLVRLVVGEDLELRRNRLLVWAFPVGAKALGTWNLEDGHFHRHL